MVDLESKGIEIRQNISFFDDQSFFSNFYFSDFLA